MSRLLVLLPKNMKLFTSLMLVIAALCYLSLLGSIWLDTEFDIDLIIEGYGSMGAIELVHHTFKHLSWFLMIFLVVGGLFQYSTAPDNWKIFSAISAPLVIFLDLFSTWMIPVASGFAWLLYISGVALAILFSFMFVIVQRDLWTNDSHG